MIDKGIIIKPFCYQKVCKPEHYMIKHNGFGISQYILNKLEQTNIKLIQIIYLGKKDTIVYYATLNQFQQSLKTFVFKDNDLQKFVSIPEMIIQ